MPPRSRAVPPPNAAAIPDGCNMGVVLRTLLAVNGAVLLASLARSGNLATGLSFFADAAPVTELACLLSLMALCALRHLGPGVAPWLQRALCILVPAAMTAATAWFLARLAGLPLTGWWIAPVVAAAMGGLLQHYFALRTRAHSPALAEARLQALQARIRPHFLFNSLNAVLALIRSQPRNAEIALEDLSELLRVLLRDARHLSTLEQELRLCRQYLAIESLRLGERLHVEWDTSGIDAGSLGSVPVPALLLQPLLENAVHHGVEPSPVAVVVRVAIRRLLDRIEITVTNPLQAVSQSGGHHMALSNIRERLALLYDVEAGLETSALHGEFTVRLRFPVLREPA